MSVGIVVAATCVGFKVCLRGVRILGAGGWRGHCHVAKIGVLEVIGSGELDPLTD